jgi:hypothetical protein
MRRSRPRARDWRQSTSVARGLNPTIRGAAVFLWSEGVNSNKLTRVPTVAVALVIMSSGVVFSFDVYARQMQWQIASGSADGGAGESGALFAAGIGLAMLAGSLRRLMQRGALEPSASLAAATQSRT